MEPKMYTYIIPKFYTNLGHNPSKFVHKNIIVAEKTYKDFSKQIDEFCISNNIKCSIPRDFKADFIIDFYNEIDPLLYNCNGIIPIMKKNILVCKHTINCLYVDDINIALDYISKLYQSLHVVNTFKENCKIVNILYNIDFFKMVWKDHIKNACTFSEYSFKNNMILVYTYFVEYFQQNIEKLVTIKMNGSSDFQVILVDNRPNPLSVLSAFITMSNLKNNFWGIKIFTSEDGYEFYKKTLGMHADIIVLEELNLNAKFHIDIYNNLLKSSKFWKKIECEKCLIIQDDGFLMRKGVEDFLEYDYIGAPWSDTPENRYLKEHVNTNMVGNGGLSIRNVSKMIEITEKYQVEKNILFFKNICKIPEDVYFTRYLVKEKAKLPNLEIAAKFSSEQIVYLKSIGTHKCWQYHGSSVVKQFFKLE